MKLKFLFSILIIIGLSSHIIGQPKYSYDPVNKSVYYETIMPFENRDKQQLLKEIEKYLLINDMKIRYMDQDEIYAVGRFETVYRSHFFFLFHNTKEYNMVYDLKFSVKDNKLKYYANNFFLLPQSLNISTKSWFSSNLSENGSSGLGSMWSTTKIPLNIPKKAIEVHYRGGKTNEKHKLFQSMDSEMTLFEDKLKKVVTGNKDW